MAYEPKDNSGSLFKNDRKETDNHPDYTGSALIDGTEYWQSAWLKKSKDGKTYMSFSYKPKNEDASPSKPRKEAPPPADDLPF